MDCLRIGQLGFSGSIRLAKYGGIDIVNLVPEPAIPFSSLGVRLTSFSNISLVVMRLRSCQRQSSQSRGVASLKKLITRFSLAVRRIAGCSGTSLTVVVLVVLGELVTFGLLIEIVKESPLTFSCLGPAPDRSA